MKNESVSVIIPVRNGSEFIGEAIKSALSQTHAADEVIVIDDGSEDDLDSVLKEFRNEIIFARQQCQGASAARNRAMAMARSEWIAFLDHDDIWVPHKLELQLSAVSGRDNIALAYSDMEVFGEENSPSRLRNFATPSGRIFKDLLLTNFITPSAVIARREAIITVGGFDIRLSSAEDLDLCLRLAAKWDILFVPGIVMKYRMHASNITKKRKAALTNLFTVLSNNASIYSPTEYQETWPKLRPLLTEISFEIGRLHLEEGNGCEARKWFVKSTSFRSRRLRSIAYYGAALLPTLAREGLRRLKRAIVGDAK